MRKFILLIISSIMFFSVSSATFASTSEKTPSIDYSKAKGHKGKSKNQLVTELENEGLSKKDADYYAKLDILIAELERQDIHIDLMDESINKLSNDYVRTNPDEYRKKILSLDKSALKTAFANNEGWVKGAEDLEKAFKNKEYQEILENGKPIGKLVTVKYPDGSTVTGSLTVKEANKDEKIVEPNTYVSNTKWDESKLFSSASHTGEGQWTATTTWQYTSGSNYAKVRDIFTYNRNKHNSSSPDFWTISYVADDGTAASAGVALAESEIPSNHKNTSADRYSYLQGYTDVKFKVTGSFSASFSGLGISVTNGATWHQFAVTEVNGGGGVVSWAAQFK
jgi:hypothetical protein